MSEPFEVDPQRVERDGTGVYVRALFEGAYGSYDLVTLKRESLLRWLREAADPMMRAEAVILSLLEHEP